MDKQLLSYISGFLDGDGCIMTQLVHRKDYVLGYQIRTSIVFYQKQNHIDFLYWLKDKLKYGYVRKRNDGMAEYTIVGHGEAREVLEKLLPYLKLKKDLAKLAIRISKVSKKPTPKELLKYASLVDKSAEYNYSKRRTNTKDSVIAYFKNHKILSP